MRTQTNKAVWRQAQTYSMMAFAAFGAILLGFGLLLDHIGSKGLRDVIEGALYVACFFAIFTVSPMTNYFYARLTRR